MNLVERLSLKLSEDQRERFLLLVAANPDTHPKVLFMQVIQET